MDANIFVLSISPLYFWSQKSPPWPRSSTPLKTPNLVAPSHPPMEWHVRRPSIESDRKDPPHSSKSPALNYGDGIALVLRYCFDSHIGYYSAQHATRVVVWDLYSTYNTINVIHCFFRTIIYELSYILLREDYIDNHLSPRFTALATDISLDPRQWGSLSLNDKESHINGGGVYAPLQNWGENHLSKCDCVISRYVRTTQISRSSPLIMYVTWDDNRSNASHSRYISLLTYTKLWVTFLFYHHCSKALKSFFTIIDLY